MSSKIESEYEKSKEAFLKAVRDALAPFDIDLLQNCEEAKFHNNWTNCLPEIRNVEALKAVWEAIKDLTYPLAADWYWNYIREEVKGQNTVT